MLAPTAFAVFAMFAVEACSDGLRKPKPAGGSPTTQSCSALVFGTLRGPVYLLFVLDGSGSMTSDRKWEAAYESLQGYFTSLYNKGDLQTAVGLTIYSDSKDTQGSGPNPYSKVDVPIFPVDDIQLAALKSRLNTSPEGDTPTFEALTGQYPLIRNFQPAPPIEPGGPKVLVIISDGVPNNESVARPGCVQLAQSALQAGVSTFSVGVGEPNDSSYDPTFMGAIAVAGGSAPAGCNPDETTDPKLMCHYQINPRGYGFDALVRQFDRALRLARGAVTTCTFKVATRFDGVVDGARARAVFKESQDGVVTQFNRDTTDGFSLNDPPTEVTLHGPACDLVKSDPAGELKIVVGCEDGGLPADL
jgi:hypothetical protein